MTKRSADFGRPLVPFREYAKGTLRGSFGEPVVAVREYLTEVDNIFRREEDGRVPLALLEYTGSDIRDADGTPVMGVSFYTETGDRTSDGRVIEPAIRYEKAGTPGAYGGHALALDLVRKVPRIRQLRTRTNLLTYSQEFDNAAWVKTGGGTGTAPVVTANYAAAPDGTMTAERAQFALNGGTTLTDISHLRQTFASVSNVTVSFWAKSATAGNQGLRFILSGGAAQNITVTPEWQRFEFFVSAANTFFDWRLHGGQTADSADVLLWGAQLEAAPKASAYIPTTNAALSVTENYYTASPLRVNYVFPSNPTATGGMWLAAGTVTLTQGFAGPDGNGPAVRMQTSAGAVFYTSGLQPELFRKRASTVSVWLKSNTGVDQTVDLRNTHNSVADYYQSVTVTPEWQRFSFTKTFGEGGSGGSPGIRTPNVADILVRDWQYEDSAVATAVIPTTSAIGLAGGISDAYGYTYTRSGGIKEELEAPGEESYLGDELVTNGTFDANITGWAVASGPGTIAWDAGQLSVSNDAGDQLLGAGTSFATVVGRTYRLSITCTASVDGWRVGVGTAANSVNISDTGRITTGPATQTIDFVATTTTTHVTAYTFPTTTAGGQVSKFDNVSVREVIPEAFESYPADVPGIVPGLGYWSRVGLTNLLLQSQNHGNASWAKTDTTITAGRIAPDGTTTADLVTEGTAGTAIVSQVVTITAGANQTASWVAKRDNHDWVRFRVDENATPANAAQVWANLATGVVGTSGVTGTGFTVVGTAIASLGNGYYRVSLTYQSATATGIRVLSCSALADNDVARAASGTRIEWQTQHVAGSQPGPVIPTTTAAASVGADRLYLQNPIQTDQDFAMWAVFNAQGGGTSTGEPLINLSDGSNTNRLQIHRASGGAEGGAVVQAAGTVVFSGTVGAALGAGRGAVLLRRRGGKYTIASKNPAGTVVVGTESAAAAWPSNLTMASIGVTGPADDQADLPIEGAFMREGTFSDADITNILSAA